MVWSEQVGTSLVVPSDRVDGDGRNYIVIGEDVPTEIADHFTAALVFRSGKYDGNAQTATDANAQAGFVFYAFGISDTGRLEFVSYFFTTGSPMAEALSYYRQTVLSIAAPKQVSSQPGAANGPVIALGNNTDYDTYTEGPAATVNVNGYGGETVIFSSFPANWSNYDTSRFDYATAVKSLNTVTLRGLIKYSGTTAVTTTVTLFTLPIDMRPPFELVFNARQNSGKQGRIEVSSNGLVQYVGAESDAFGTGTNWVSLSGITFTTV